MAGFFILLLSISTTFFLYAISIDGLMYGLFTCDLFLLEQRITIKHKLMILFNLTTIEYYIHWGRFSSKARSEEVDVPYMNIIGCAGECSYAYLVIPSYQSAFYFSKCQISTITDFIMQSRNCDYLTLLFNHICKLSVQSKIEKSGIKR